LHPTAIPPKIDGFLNLTMKRSLLSVVNNIYLLT
jgi:hypothetical protein